MPTPTTTPLIGLATSREVDGLDDERHVLADLLDDRGARLSPVVWDDDDVDWAAFDLVVVRSTWDYITRLEEFLAWAEHVNNVSRLENPPAVLKWTTDKHYLQELAAAGVPTVPSYFLEPGDDPDHRLTDVEHVAKPAVSAGSRDTLRLGPREADRSRAHVSRLLDAGRSVLVQPYLPEVDQRGETAMVFLDGALSHAIRKAPLLKPAGELVQGLFAPEHITPRVPDPAERDVAARALAAGPGEAPPLYARVDLLPTSDGPLVLELELAEPSLFLEHAPGSAERLADAILARVTGR